MKRVVNWSLITLFVFGAAQQSFAQQASAKVPATVQVESGQKDDAFDHPTEIEDIVRTAFEPHSLYVDNKKVKALCWLRVGYRGLFELEYRWREYKSPDGGIFKTLKEAVIRAVKIEGPRVLADLLYRVPGLGRILEPVADRTAQEIAWREYEADIARYYRITIYDCSRWEAKFHITRFDRQTIDAAWSEPRITEFVQEYTVLVPQTENGQPPDVRVRRVVNHQESQDIHVDVNWKSWVIADAVSTALSGGI